MWSTCYSAMVPSREHLIKRAAQAITAATQDPAFPIPPEVDEIIQQEARAVVDALLPEITNPQQLLGVPEGSVLFVERKVDRENETFFFTWRGGRLHGLGGASSFIPEYILRWGTLTVVWMP